MTNGLVTLTVMLFEFRGIPEEIMLWGLRGLPLAAVVVAVPVTALVEPLLDAVAEVALGVKLYGLIVAPVLPRVTANNLAPINPSKASRHEIAP
jgi:hypothetical protein